MRAGIEGTIPVGAGDNAFMMDLILIVRGEDIGVWGFLLYIGGSDGFLEREFSSTGHMLGH